VRQATIKFDLFPHHLNFIISFTSFSRIHTSSLYAPANEKFILLEKQQSSLQFATLSSSFMTNLFFSSCGSQ